jgi:hypothetical protein
MRRLIALGLLAVALGGCSGPSRKPGVATVGGTASGRPTASPSPVDRAEQIRLFTKCMREHGIDVPDPATNPGDGGGTVIFGDPQQGGPDPTKIEAATKACEQYLPNGGDPPKPDPAQVESMRKFAKCMREHGVPDFPDPDDKGGVKIGGPGDGGALDPGDPKMKAAQQECQKFMPMPPSQAVAR